MTNKIVRSICLYGENTLKHNPDILASIEEALIAKDFIIQTKRCVFDTHEILRVSQEYKSHGLLLSLGKFDIEEYKSVSQEFLNTRNINVQIDLTSSSIDRKVVETLFEVINISPQNTFRFAYTFNNPISSPYFPSASYERDGFSIGLQSPDLSSECKTLEEWFSKMKEIWQEIYDLFHNDPLFLGIDSSIAPLGNGNGSLINFIKRLGFTFNQSVLSNLYTQMTHFIKHDNPHPVGLCGLMLPCLEDFELADEYENGNFDIKTNLFLSLHSGLGIDTYPIGIDENKDDVINILKLVQSLSRKYTKPLSIRFVSDGKTKIGEKTDFQNPYLKDVKIRSILP
jgi:uncharacterized protein (UPF0210 family)